MDDFLEINQTLVAVFLLSHSFTKARAPLCRLSQSPKEADAGSGDNVGQHSLQTVAFSPQLASQRLILGEQFGNPFAQLVQFRF